MLISKLSLHHATAIHFLTKRTFFSKLFPCGCFGKKKKEPEVPLTLTKESNIVSKGMCMPIVGLGTWQLRTADVQNAVMTAVCNGYRHIDTAFVYGNEKEIGDALNNLFSTGKITREQLFISSKLPYYAMQSKDVEEYLNKSLCNLGLQYLDLYLIHFPVGVKKTDNVPCPDHNTNHIAIWRAMESQVDKGKVKNIGLSNFNLRQITNILECARIPPSNIQVEMHLYCQQKAIKEFCKKHCIGMTAYAPLGSPGLQCFAQSRGLAMNDVPKPLENPSVQKMADWHKKCPSQILLRHLIQLGGVAVIPKSRCQEHILKNIELFDFCMEPCEMKEMNSMDKGDAGRMFSCNIWPGTERHTEYPF